jgi:ribosomal protein L29
VSGQLTDTSRLRILRREIARMQTVLHEQAKTETATEGEA